MTANQDDPIYMLAKKLFPAYEIYVSAGCTNGAFERHIWPIIAEIHKLLHINPAITYAAGYRNEPDSYGMFAGPVPTINEILEYEPDHNSDRPAFIFKFDEKRDSKAIARWDMKRNKWRFL